jgi:hypothetical protein
MPHEALAGTVFMGRERVAGRKKKQRNPDKKDL